MKALCAFDGCGKPSRKLRLCSTHYDQQWKGRPLTPIGPNPRKAPVGTPLAERLALHTQVDPETGCWLWTGSINDKGYGLTNVNGKTVSAHRTTYQCHVGPVPAGLTLDHLCRVPRCVNPAHLEPVTQAENNRRAVLARIRNATCKWGHPFDSENTYTYGSKRNCRACGRASQRRGSQRKRLAREALASGRAA